MYLMYTYMHLFVFRFSIAFLERLTENTEIIDG